MRAALAAVAFLLAAGSAEACNQGREICSFTLVNETRVQLNSFYASPSTVNRWEEDLLGNDVLAAGRRIVVNMSDGRPDCVYDFKFEFADGDVIERRRVDVCSIGTYTLTQR